ncbi:MAG: D-proline reductase subunit gamma [Pelotomaculum sp. PtaB.Bin104]|nr:MAG: D-proline reductase subunit gamma [Pelotomaculum sp. PtaB.Bin104]
MSDFLLKMREFIREKWVPNFEYVVNDAADIPWAKLNKRLNQCKVAVISTGGFYQKADHPFDAENPAGDPSYRSIPKTATRADLAIAHTHYDHKYVNEDLNVALPLEIFRQYERRGIIGELAETNYSFMGYIPVAGELINTTAPEVAERLAAAGVDAVFLAPT